MHDVNSIHLSSVQAETNAQVNAHPTYIPRISIITPSYNQSSYLERCILSVTRQKYPNIEYIIIDGGSDDETISVIKKYESYINYWESKVDDGTYDALNKALDIMTGDYWIVVNSDDYLCENALWNFVLKINKLGIFSEKWITGGGVIVDQNDNVLDSKIPTAPKLIAGLSFLGFSWIFHASTFLSKDVFREFGYFKPLHALDTEYWLRLELSGLKPYVLDTNISCLRYHDEAKTIAIQDQIMEEQLEIFLNLEDKYNIDLDEKAKMELQSFVAHWKFLICSQKVAYALKRKKKWKAFLLYLNDSVRYPGFVFKRDRLGLLKKIVYNSL